MGAWDALAPGGKTVTLLRVTCSHGKSVGESQTEVKDLLSCCEAAVHARGGNVADAKVESCSSALTSGPLLLFVPGPVAPWGVIFICVCPASPAGSAVKLVTSKPTGAARWKLKMPPSSARGQRQTRRLYRKETSGLGLMFGSYFNFVSIAIPENSLIHYKAQKCRSVFPPAM